ncbi:hypothetical protein ABIE69_001438 [Rhodobacteraceae bacterium MBR-64]
MLFYPKGRVRADATGHNRPAPAPMDPAPMGIAEAAVMSEPLATGLLASTRIATARGWVPASRLRAGDQVLTFDSGCQPLRGVDRGGADIDPSDARATDQGLNAAVAQVSVPSGALENRSPLMLMPGQVVLLESDIAEAMFGDPFALVPAAALVGWRGIEAVVSPAAPILHLRLRLDRDEIVYANGSTLLLCPAVPGTTPGAGDGPAPGRPLPMHAARQFVARLIDQETVPEVPGTPADSPV